MRTILSVNSVIKQSANWNGGWKRVSLCVGRSLCPTLGTQAQMRTKVTLFMTCKIKHLQKFIVHTEVLQTTLD